MFRTGLESIVRGEILVPPLRSYLANPEFRGFDLKVRGIGSRDPDGWFHPSEHPRWPLRALWLWLCVPSLVEREPLGPETILAMTAGSIWHAIIERALLDMDMLIGNEVRFEHPATMTRGSADGHLRMGDLMEFKGLAMDTPLPTPTGWTTMADVVVGDSLIGSDGKPCTVTGVSTPKWVRGMRMSFDDGTSILCDIDHRWAVASGRARRMTMQTLTSAEIAESVDGVHGQSQHRVYNTAPIDLPEIDAPIHPYVLGAWIGDGAKHNGAITQGADSALWAEIEACGYRIGAAWGGGLTRTVFGLRTQLIAMGLLNEQKRIPDAYLRGSIEQRTALLQGLMDTDGTWSQQRKNAVYTTVDSELADQVRELVLSLGMRCRVQKFLARGFGIERVAYHVVFRPFGVVPFRMKADRVLSGDAVRSGRRVIQRVDRLPEILTKCVEVDSADNTYLCGDQMVPTHNSMKDMNLRKIDSVETFIARHPDYHLQAQEYMRMSGIERMRFVLMALTFPFEMREFVVEYDHIVAQRTADKYRTAIQMVADKEVPMCDGCPPKQFCPARNVCTNATNAQLKEWMT